MPNPLVSQIEIDNNVYDIKDAEARNKISELKLSDLKTDDNHQFVSKEEKEKWDSGSITIDDTLSDTSENPVQNKVIKGELDKVFQSVSDGKSKIASAITDKGVKTDKDATFDIMADNIKKIETDDTGVTPVLTGEAFYVQPFFNYSSFEVLTGTLLGIKEEQLAIYAKDNIIEEPFEKVIENGPYVSQLYSAPANNQQAYVSKKNNTISNWNLIGMLAKPATPNGGYPYEKYPYTILVSKHRYPIGIGRTPQTTYLEYSTLEYQNETYYYIVKNINLHWNDIGIDHIVKDNIIPFYHYDINFTNTKEGREYIVKTLINLYNEAEDKTIYEIPLNFTLIEGSNYYGVNLYKWYTEEKHYLWWNIPHENPTLAKHDWWAIGGIFKRNSDNLAQITVVMKERDLLELYYINNNNKITTINTINTINYYDTTYYYISIKGVAFDNIILNSVIKYDDITFQGSSEEETQQNAAKALLDLYFNKGV